MDNKRSAIVMGATSGIGYEVAIILARRGWRIGVAGRRVSSHLGPSCEP